MQGGKLKNYERWTPWRKNRKEKEEKIKIKNIRKGETVKAPKEKKFVRMSFT